MKTMLLAVVLCLAACGGTEPAPYEGTWNVQFGQGVSGTMTLSPSGTDGIQGTWDFGSFGKGTVAGAIAFEGNIDLLFATPETPQHPLAGDATIKVNGATMAGTARPADAAPDTFTAQRGN